MVAVAFLVINKYFKSRFLGLVFSIMYVIPVIIASLHIQMSTSFIIVFMFMGFAIIQAVVYLLTCFVKDNNKEAVSDIKYYTPMENSDSTNSSSIIDLTKLSLVFSLPGFMFSLSSIMLNLESKGIINFAGFYRNSWFASIVSIVLFLILFFGFKFVLRIVRPNKQVPVKPVILYSVLNIVFGLMATLLIPD